MLQPQGLQQYKQMTVVDLWDGYIDFTFDEFDFAGNVFEPVVGDIISDVQIPNDGQGGLAITTQTSSTAEVAFYRRNFNSVRVYVKSITGLWAKLNNIGKYSIQRNANTVARGAADVYRIMGSVADVENDIAVGTTTVGKLIVFNHSSQFNIVSNPEIIDEEYWFFNETTEQGISRVANPPYSLNKDYTQVFNIEANSTGNIGPASEGAVAIYRRKPGGVYDRQHVFVSEHRKANRGFGKKVKLVQKDNYYTLAVSSQGLGTREDPGSIEFFRHGTKPTSNFKGSYQVTVYAVGDIVIYLDDYYECIKATTTSTAITDSIFWNKISWRNSKDRNYRGIWDNSYRYKKDGIVEYNDVLYKAKTNIAAGAIWASSSWDVVSSNIDYIGMLPNRTSKTFYSGESVFDPIQNIQQFSKDFDLSANGDVLVTTSEQLKTDSTRDIAIVVYREVDDKFQFSQLITEATSNDGYADKISLHPDGTRFAVSAPLVDTTKINQGVVYVYKQDTAGVFGTVTNSALGITTPTQTLLPPQDEESERFGYNLNFGKENLAVSSLNGDQRIATKFDTYEKNKTDSYELDPTSKKKKILLHLIMNLLPLKILK